MSYRFIIFTPYFQSEHPLYFIVFLLFFVSSFPLTAQEELTAETVPIKHPMFVGASFQTLLPQDIFGEKMNQAGYGGQLEFLVNLNSPFYLGFTSAIANFGNEVYEFVDADGFDLEWKTNSSLWSTHLLLRYEPPVDFSVQPYLSGQIGGNHFFTASRLVDPNLDDNATLERYIDDKDWGWSFGGSIGFLIPMDKNWRTMLDFRCTYLKGNSSSFYSKRENFTILEDSIEAFSLEQSPIDMVSLHIGVLVFIE